MLSVTIFGRLNNKVFSPVVEIRDIEMCVGCLLGGSQQQPNGGTEEHTPQAHAQNIAIGRKVQNSFVENE